MNKQCFAWIVIAFVVLSCQAGKEITTTGSIDKLDPALDQIISVNDKIEVLGDGYTWSEGPVWVESQKMLLFSDVPQDTVYKWTEKNGVEVYLTPSGYTGTGISQSRERGANGLLINSKGQLVLCQHGDRRVAVMDAPLDKPEPKYTTIASGYKGKRFDSPNDAVYDKNGNLYLTDPPYGLKDKELDKTKEIPYQGVYKVFPDGKVILLVDTIAKPNGIALSPDQKFLYIASSEASRARWYRYELGDSGVVSGKIFYDISAEAGQVKKGVPDGMKVDSRGNIYASGPVGIYIFSPAGKILGKINLDHNTANCALSKDEKWLFITSKNNLLRVRLK